jgi:hypothetical protein
MPEDGVGPQVQLCKILKNSRNQYIVVNHLAPCVVSQTVSIISIVTF